MKLTVATGMSTCNGIEELQEIESVGRCKDYIWIKTAPPKRRFLDWQLESFEKLEKMADPSQMNSFVKSMQRKVKMFKKAWSSGFVSFNIENCINSTFDEEEKAHFEVQQKTAEIDLMFTCNKNRDFWTFETVVFPIWFKYHFFLIIGYPKEQRIVYYNSMMGYTSYDDYANHFVDFLRKKFLEVGWIDPMFWSFEIGNPNPQQTNNFDCGIFTMANAEHASYRRAIEYTQADIWYYRQKIVTDIYKKQKQLYSYFFESQKIS
ncbi:hypothetical protein AAC387_Pa02g0839 [Persea americana]